MFKKILSALAVLACSASGTAFAQDSGADAQSPDANPNKTPAVAETSGGLEDIVVTATRREERLQDVPVAVTAITNAALGGAGVGILRELTLVVPGFQGGRNSGVNQPTIRGVGSSGVGMADEANVATYIDGVYHPFSFTSSLDLVEIERIEVLRGPQGTVFGRNATGGLVNVITPDPSFTTKGRVEARFGRMRNDANEIDLRTYVTGGLNDKIAMDFAGLYRDNGGFITDLVRGGGLGDSRMFNVRSKLLFEPSETARIILMANYVDHESSVNTVRPYGSNTAAATIPGVILPKGPWEASLTEVPISNYEQVTINLHTAFDLGSVSLQTTTGYIDNNGKQFTDSDASNILLGQIPFDTSGKSFSQEVRLLSTGRGRFKWIAGLYFFKLDAGFENIQLQNSAGPGQPVTVTRLDPSSKVKSYAAFGEGTYEVIDSLFLTAGVRYTEETRRFTTLRNLVPLPFGRAKASFNKWTYRVALRYNFADSANVYASYGTGFKSGVFNELGVLGTATRPETIKAAEIGLKADPLSWLRTNLSIYRYKYNDLQVQARDAAGVSYILQNAANAEIYGGELEVTAAVTKDLNLRGALVYTHAEYTSFPAAQGFVPRPTGGNQVVPSDASGNHMIRAPRHTINLGFDWGRDVGSGRLQIVGNLFHSARVYYDFLNLASQKPYTTLSGEMSWTSPNEAWRFSIWAKNITNEAYVQTLRPGALGTDAIFERPRQVGLGAAYRF